jgi:hypothetical protein
VLYIKAKSCMSLQPQVGLDSSDSRPSIHRFRFPYMTFINEYTKPFYQVRSMILRQIRSRKNQKQNQTTRKKKIVSAAYSK